MKRQGKVLISCRVFSYKFLVLITVCQLAIAFATVLQWLKYYLCRPAFYVKHSICYALKLRISLCGRVYSVGYACIFEIIVLRATHLMLFYSFLSTVCLIVFSLWIMQLVMTLFLLGWIWCRVRQPFRHGRRRPNGYGSIWQRATKLNIMMKNGALH